MKCTEGRQPPIIWLRLRTYRSSARSYVLLYISECWDCFGLVWDYTFTSYCSYFTLFLFFSSVLLLLFFFFLLSIVLFPSFVASHRIYWSSVYICFLIVKSCRWKTLLSFSILYNINIILSFVNIISTYIPGPKRPWFHTSFPLNTYTHLSSFVRYVAFVLC